MFRYVKLKNFKSFSDIEFDLTDYSNNVRNLYLLYGENGSGKSNFVSAFNVLYELSNTILDNKFSNELLLEFSKIEKPKKSDPSKFLKDLLFDQFFTTSKVINNYKTIGSKKPLYMEFGFEIEKEKGYYYIELDDNQIIREGLYYKINNRNGEHFKISFTDNKIKTFLSKSIFTSTEYLNELKIQINKYWGKHSFLSIIQNEKFEKNKEFIISSINNNFLQAIYELRSFTFHLRGSKIEKIRKSNIINSIDDIISGEIDIENEKELNKLENFLSDFYSNLYADIKKIYFKKSITEKTIKYDLYFQKIIGGNLLDIPFNLESTGTQQILKLIPAIVEVCKGGVVIIDEFDNGIHDLLAKELLINLSKSITGQLIITTHNTAILESSIAKQAANFITIDYNGNKEVLSISDYDHRTQENNNIRNLYLKGMYEGVPQIEDFDLHEIICNNNLDN